MSRTIPRLENCGMFWAKTNDGRWHYLNHADTWQGFQGPESKARIAALETATRECLGWIRHWQADVAGNLKPTPDSLAMMEAKLVAILEASR